MAVPPRLFGESVYQASLDKYVSLSFAAIARKDGMIVASGGGGAVYLAEPSTNKVPVRIVSTEIGTSRPTTSR
jgi:hypothetical protein